MYNERKNTKGFGVKKPKVDGIKLRPRREGRGSQQEVKIKNKKNGLNQLFRILKHTPVYYIGSLTQPTILVRILIFSTVIAIYSMWIAYTTAFSSVSLRRTKARIYINLTFTVICFVFFLGPFVGCLLASFGLIMKKRQREGEGNQQNVTIQMITH